MRATRGCHVRVTRGVTRGGHVRATRGCHVRATRGCHVRVTRGGHVRRMRGGHVRATRGGHVRKTRGCHVMRVASAGHVIMRSRVVEVDDVDLWNSKSRVTWSREWTLKRKNSAFLFYSFSPHFFLLLSHHQSLLSLLLLVSCGLGSDRVPVSVLPSTKCPRFIVM